MDDLLFGFQYYRAPTPIRENWEGDLRKIAADGFNVVKFWVQWRWNNPAPGIYDFSDLDELMRLSAEVGLKVVLNFIMDVAPAWLYRAYPDCVMETCSGEKLYPTSTMCRQIGGAPGPCFHHTTAAEKKYDFLRVAVDHFKDAPALHSWDIWNEPELTVAIKRVAVMEDIVCYCPHCLAAFRDYLREKYVSLETLNASWGRNYVFWEEIEPPRVRGTTNDMQDWRLFFLDTLTEDAQKRTEIIRKTDASHAVTCHTVPIPLFNSITCASDDFEIAKFCDYFGNSAGSDAFSARMLASVARGKSVINSEIHAVWGSTEVNYRRPDEQSVLRHIAVGLGNGVKGFLFWQYRPEILGLEAPAWGSVGLDGKDTSWHREVIRINRYLQENREIIMSAPAPSADTAVFVDKRNEICMWNVTGDTSCYGNSLRGAFGMLYDNHRNVDFITREEIVDGILSHYRTVYFPVLHYLDRKTASIIFDWIHSGGTAIFEPQLAIIREENGLHESSLPGLGFDTVLGISLEEMHSSVTIDNAYHESRHSENEGFRISSGEVTGWGEKYVCRYRRARDVAVVAEYADGTPACLLSRVGTGRAFVFCSMFAAAYPQHPQNAMLFGKILGFSSELPIGVRRNVISGRGKSIAIIENNTDYRQSILVSDKVVFGEAVREGNLLRLSPRTVMLTERIE